MAIHHVIYLKARGYGSEAMGTAPCEFCIHRRQKTDTPSPRRPVEHIHHIDTSFRAKRKNEVNNLLGVCHVCHDDIHNRHGNSQTIQNISRVLAKKAIEIAKQHIDIDEIRKARKKEERERK